MAGRTHAGVPGPAVVGTGPWRSQLAQLCSALPASLGTFPGDWEAGGEVASQSAWAAVTKHHKLGCLETTDIYFQRFWRLEVGDQGADMAAFWQESSSRLQTANFDIVERRKALSYSIKALSPSTRGSILKTSPHPNYLSMAPPPNTIASGEVKLEHANFGQTNIFSL